MEKLYTEIVRLCLNCPNIHIYNKRVKDEPVREYRCGAVISKKFNLRMIHGDIYNFPEWCPLETVKEG